MVSKFTVHMEEMKQRYDDTASPATTQADKNHPVKGVNHQIRVGKISASSSPRFPRLMDTVIFICCLSVPLLHSFKKADVRVSWNTLKLAFGLGANRYVEKREVQSMVAKRREHLTKDLGAQGSQRDFFHSFLSKVLRGSEGSQQILLNSRKH